VPALVKGYKKVILVTQGTIEKDPEKLLVPTIEAFKNTDRLVIATTGGSRTEELRARYPHTNIVIEDFIPFGDVLPFADVYVTNGGYGGVMLSIEHQVPMVVAGVHEGKNEINARVGYFQLGVNLKTETPSPELIRKSVSKVFSERQYRLNAARLGIEFRKYNPKKLCEKYVYEATGYRKEEIQLLALQE
jgi:UDP:flavonoid glycosyltransferase YjiC (YdhE family)